MPNETAAILHHTYIVLDYNDRACEMFGCDEPNWLHDRRVVDLVAEDFQDLVRLRMAALREHGALRDLALPFVRRDGTIFWANVKSERVESDEYQSTLLYRATW